VKDIVEFPVTVLVKLFAVIKLIAVAPLPEPNDEYVSLNVVGAI